MPACSTMKFISYAGGGGKIQGNIPEHETILDVRKEFTVTLFIS